MALRAYLQGEAVQDFADGLTTRREALRRLGLLGVSMTGAATLLAACSSDGSNSTAGSSPATPSSSTATTATAQGAGSAGELITFAGPSSELKGAFAEASDTPKGAVLVIHENRGLTPHFHDLVGRLARDGYTALAIDLLSNKGGTEALSDPAAAPTELANRPSEQLVAEMQAGLTELQERVPGAKLGTVGFCFGGGMVWNLLDAGEPRLAAAVPFYGPAPENPDFSKSTAAVLAIYGENDARVNATRETAEEALSAAGLPHEMKTYPGADHAFFNDTGQRYNQQAATDAYTTMLNWYGTYLA